MNRLRTLGLLTLFVTSVPAIAQPSPPNPGRTLLTQNCLICHGPELIEGQRLTPEQWEKEIEKMVGWGSPLKDSDRAALLKYLNQEYSTSSPPPVKKTRKPVK